MQNTYKTQIIEKDLKGLDIYLNPFIFMLSEDKKQFYYSETGVLVSARKYNNSNEYNKKYRGKFIVNVQYDYRSGDDLNNFGFCKNTGTYGIELFCDDLNDAITKTLDFLNSDFTDYRTFFGEKIEQKNIVSIREVAKSQSLHHNATFSKHIKEDDLYLKLIKACGEEETLNKYILINENREKASKKYLSKLENRFLKDFEFELKEIVLKFQISINKFNELIKGKDLNENQKSTIKKVLKYYR